MTGERHAADDPGRRESGEPPEGRQNREREGPGVEDPATHPEPVAPEEEDDDEDARVDRDAAETFPASDPPGNY